jgi:hypothetical protein
VAGVLGDYRLGLNVMLEEYKGRIMLKGSN